MNYNFILSAAAEMDIRKSFDWYEKQSDGLGTRFIENVNHALDAISKSPEAYHNRYGETREFVINKFPYVIIYRFLEKKDFIYILRIFHTSRNPKLKYKRK